jgi:hypothetical protein
MNKGLIRRLSLWIDSLNSTLLMSALLIAVAGFFWLFNFSTLPPSNPELVRLSGHDGLLQWEPFDMCRVFIYNRASKGYEWKITTSYGR